MVSTGEGRTTCGYFLPDNKHILYASTHEAGDACPAAADRSKGYVWAVYPTYKVYLATDDGNPMWSSTFPVGEVLIYPADTPYRKCLETAAPVHLPVMDQEMAKKIARRWRRRPVSQLLADTAAILGNPDWLCCRSLHPRPSALRRHRICCLVGTLDCLPG